MTHTHCILTCDGGGIRGLVTAIMLERLESKLQAKEPTQQLRDYFDLIAGTSTGSLIAFGISQGISASEIRTRYQKQGIKIFSKFNEVFSSILFGIRPVYS